MTHNQSHHWTRQPGRTPRPPKPTTQTKSLPTRQSTRRSRGPAGDRSKEKREVDTRIPTGKRTDKTGRQHDRLERVEPQVMLQGQIHMDTGTRENRRKRDGRRRGKTSSDSRIKRTSEATRLGVTQITTAKHSGNKAKAKGRCEEAVENRME